MKTCKICKEEKEISEFYVKDKKTNRLETCCKICNHIKQRDKRKLNPIKEKEKNKKQYLNSRERRINYAREYRKKYPEKTRATNWKSKYNLTPDDFYNKLNNQNNKCAICERDMNDYGKIFCVDHSHETNKVRGLLCDPCNYGLGFYEKYKHKYEEYLEKHK